MAVTLHVKSLGAKKMSREVFLKRLKTLVNEEVHQDSCKVKFP